MDILASRNRDKESQRKNPERNIEQNRIKDSGLKCNDSKVAKGIQGLHQQGKGIREQIINFEDKGRRQAKPFIASNRYEGAKECLTDAAKKENEKTRITNNTIYWMHSDDMRQAKEKETNFLGAVTEAGDRIKEAKRMEKDMESGAESFTEASNFLNKLEEDIKGNKSKQAIQASAPMNVKEKLQYAEKEDLEKDLLIYQEYMRKTEATIAKAESILSQKLVKQQSLFYELGKHQEPSNNTVNEFYSEINKEKPDTDKIIGILKKEEREAKERLEIAKKLEKIVGNTDNLSFAELCECRLRIIDEKLRICNESNNANKKEELQRLKTSEKTLIADEEKSLATGIKLLEATSKETKDDIGTFKSLISHQRTFDTSFRRLILAQEEKIQKQLKEQLKEQIQTLNVEQKKAADIMNTMAKEYAEKDVKSILGETRSHFNKTFHQDSVERLDRLIRQGKCYLYYHPLAGRVVINGVFWNMERIEKIDGDGKGKWTFEPDTSRAQILIESYGRDDKLQDDKEYARTLADGSLDLGVAKIEFIYPDNAANNRWEAAIRIKRQAKDGTWTDEVKEVNLRTLRTIHIQKRFNEHGDLAVTVEAIHDTWPSNLGEDSKRAVQDVCRKAGTGAFTPEKTRHMFVFNVEKNVVCLPNGREMPISDHNKNAIAVWEGIGPAWRTEGPTNAGSGLSMWLAGWKDLQDQDIQNCVKDLNAELFKHASNAVDFLNNLVDSKNFDEELFDSALRHIKGELALIVSQLDNAQEKFADPPKNELHHKIASKEELDYDNCKMIEHIKEMIEKNNKVNDEFIDLLEKDSKDAIDAGKSSDFLRKLNKSVLHLKETFTVWSYDQSEQYETIHKIAKDAGKAIKELTLIKETGKKTAEEAKEAAKNAGKTRKAAEEAKKIANEAEKAAEEARKAAEKNVIDGYCKACEKYREDNDKKAFDDFIDGIYLDIIENKAKAMIAEKVKKEKVDSLKNEILEKKRYEAAERKMNDIIAIQKKRLDDCIRNSVNIQGNKQLRIFKDKERINKIVARITKAQKDETNENKLKRLKDATTAVIGIVDNAVKDAKGINNVMEVNKAMNSERPEKMNDYDYKRHVKIVTEGVKQAFKLNVYGNIQEKIYEEDKKLVENLVCEVIYQCGKELNEERANKVKGILKSQHVSSNAAAIEESERLNEQEINEQETRILMSNAIIEAKKDISMCEGISGENMLNLINAAIDFQRPESTDIDINLLGQGELTGKLTPLAKKALELLMGKAKVGDIDAKNAEGELLKAKNEVSSLRFKRYRAVVDSIMPDADASEKVVRSECMEKDKTEIEVAANKVKESIKDVEELILNIIKDNTEIKNKIAMQKGKAKDVKEANNVENAEDVETIIDGASKETEKEWDDKKEVWAINYKLEKFSDNIKENNKGNKKLQEKIDGIISLAKQNDFLGQEEGNELEKFKRQQDKEEDQKLSQSSRVYKLDAAQLMREWYRLGPYAAKDPSDDLSLAERYDYLQKHAMRKQIERILFTDKKVHQSYKTQFCIAKAHEVALKDNYWWRENGQKEMIEEGVYSWLRAMDVEIESYQDSELGKSRAKVLHQAREAINLLINDDHQRQANKVLLPILGDLNHMLEADLSKLEKVKLALALGASNPAEAKRILKEDFSDKRQRSELGLDKLEDNKDKGEKSNVDLMDEKTMDGEYFEGQTKLKRSEYEELRGKIQKACYRRAGEIFESMLNGLNNDQRAIMERNRADLIKEIGKQTWEDYQKGEARMFELYKLKKFSKEIDKQRWKDMMFTWALLFMQNGMMSANKGTDMIMRQLLKTIEHGNA